jgi:anti-sigma factor RsiW
MNCHALERQIALYVGADLDAQETMRVEEHLATCSDCRQLLEDLQATHSALRELASDAVDAAMLTAVRSRVLSGIGERRKWSWPWVAAIALAAPLIVGLIIPWWMAVEPLPPAPLVHAPAPEPVMTTGVVEKPPAPRRRRVVKRPPAPVWQEEQPLVVKMLTDDPDIVIIWLVDQRGD